MLSLWCIDGLMRQTFSYYLQMSPLLLLLLSCAAFSLLSKGTALDKLRIDPANRLYVSSVDARVSFLHGLALEDSSPPWTLATYSDKQIQLMKAVRPIKLCSPPVTF